MNSQKTNDKSELETYKQEKEDYIKEKKVRNKVRKWLTTQDQKKYNL